MGRPTGSQDYSNVEIPTEKPREEFTYAERRAEILKLILTAGHPGLVSRTELAKMYGKTHQQISLDIKAIVDGVREWMGKDADLVTQSVYEKAVKSHLKSDDLKDHAKAADLISKWNEYLWNSGIKRKAPESIEHLGSTVQISFEGITAYPPPEDLERERSED